MIAGGILPLYRGVCVCGCECPCESGASKNLNVPVSAGEQDLGAGTAGRCPRCCLAQAFLPSSLSAPRTQFAVFIPTAPSWATPPPASQASHSPPLALNQPSSPPFQFSPLFRGRLAGAGVLESREQQVVGDLLLKDWMLKTEAHFPSHFPGVGRNLSLNIIAKRHTWKGFDFQMEGES